MVIQLELFPDYPRLAYTPPAPPPSEWDWLQEAWDTLYYPEENDNDIMGQNSTQDLLINYIRAVLQACLVHVENGFVASDLFMHRTIEIQDKDLRNVPLKQAEVLAPDVLFVSNALPTEERGSFNAKKEEKLLREAWLKKHGTEMSNKDFRMQMFVIEIMSPSNYQDKNDQFKRYNFYKEEGVYEYLVIHTKNNKLSLEFYTRIGGLLMRTLDLPTQTSALACVTFTIEDGDLVMRTLTGDKFNRYDDEREIRINAQSLLKSQEAALEEERTEKELAQSLLKSQQVALEEERTEKERERAMRQKMEAKLAKIENQLAQEREEAQKKIAFLQWEFEKMTEQWKK